MDAGRCICTDDIGTNAFAGNFKDGSLKSRRMVARASDQCLWLRPINSLRTGASKTCCFEIHKLKRISTENRLYVYMLSCRARNHETIIFHTKWHSEWADYRNLDIIALLETSLFYSDFNSWKVRHKNASYPLV